MSRDVRWSYTPSFLCCAHNCVVLEFPEFLARVQTKVAFRGGTRGFPRLESGNTTSMDVETGIMGCEGTPNDVGQNENKSKLVEMFVVGPRETLPVPESARQLRRPRQVENELMVPMRTQTRNHK